MKKIFKLLGKYSLQIVIIIALLFFQASCNLALPDYTSRIVDVGIQQGGIEDNVLEVIRQSEYEKLLLFMDEEDQEFLNNNYTLISQGNSGYVEEYPLIAEENLYVLNDINEETRTKLDDILSMPIFMVEVLSSNNENILALLGDYQLPNNGIDIFTVLNTMSFEERSTLISEIEEKLNSIESSLLTQYNIEYVKAEYTEIGLDLENMQLNYIIISGLKMLGISLLGMVFTIMSAYLASRVASSFSKDLRSEVANKVMKFSNKEFEDFSTASLITRSTNDIQQVQMLVVMGLRLIFFAPIMGIGAFLKVRGNSMSWVIGLALAAIIVLVGVLFGIALPKFKSIQKLIDKLNLVSREILTGIPVIRAFGNEKYEEKRFDKANVDLTKTNIFVNRLMSIMMPSMMFIMNGISILIIWVGASKVDLGTLQVGDLIASISYTMEIIISFLMLSVMSIMIPRAFVSIRRIADVFDKEISVTNKEKTQKLPNKVIEQVEFRDVYFRYPDAEEDVIQNVSFTSKKGTTTAFIGSTGSGKSTLINLIPRLYDVTGGKILVDNVDIRDLKIEDLRHHIGFVPQKGILFSGTIKENIAFGTKKITENDLKEAATISQAIDFINEKEDGFDSEISQGGTNVSGGQRQRLAIARAIARKPDIYVFDDSFSALDYKTDLKLRKALNKVTKNSIIFIVAQRISTVMAADQIIVLDKGDVVGIGTHSELMKKCDVYKEIALSQLSKEELENE